MLPTLFAAMLHTRAPLLTSFIHVSDLKHGTDAVWALPTCSRPSAWLAPCSALYAYDLQSRLWTAHPNAGLVSIMAVSQDGACKQAHLRFSLSLVAAVTVAF
jgi:pyrroloquinoline quinone (PQQ) biosynthesis protein C